MVRRLPRDSIHVLAVLLVVLSAPRIGHALPPGALRDAALAANFNFGVAVDTNTTGTRLALAASEFTSATAENAMKWRELSPSPGVYDFTAADAFVSWATAQGHRIRGHTLFWTRLNGLPTWVEPEVTAAADPAAALTQLMKSHAAAVVGRYAGQIAQWDVVNEPLALLSTSHDPESLFYQTLGESYLDIAFDAAHAADPNALLFLNETLIEDLPAKLPGLVTLVQGMISRGVPIHGVGLQGHFLFNPPNISQLRSDIETLAALGLVVEFTEVDIRLPLFASAPEPLAAQAEAYEALTALCLELVPCTGITVWGIDDADTWLDTFSVTSPDAPNRPLLFDEAFAQKPAYGGVVAALQASLPGVPALSTLARLGLVALLLVYARGAMTRSCRTAT
jgi:endo-1,4-beta-xylanase